MSRSRRTEKQIKNNRARRYDYIGNEEVAGKLQEIEFQPSTLETIDGAMLKFIDEELDLSVYSNNGFKKVPVQWVTAERAFQLKHDKDLRDKEGTLILPLITVNRFHVTKEPGYKGTVYANLYPVNDEKGGTITVARQINQKKTAEFQNALSRRKYGANKDVSSKMYNTNKRNMSTSKVVYETITMPLPTWVKVTYEISLRAEYQQQLNDLITPFFTISGNSKMPKRIENEGHYYELFIQGTPNNNSNQANLGMDQRNYENTFSIEVLGYLMGEGPNQDRPKVVKRENAVDLKLGRERTMLGEIPNSIKDGFYRE